MWGTENKNIRSFGSYGDVIVRDRKMYVAPTPFALVEGKAHYRTLLLPWEMEAEDDLIEIGILTRREAMRTTVAYNLDNWTNELETELVGNPNGGRSMCLMHVGLTAIR